jgi:uncharacterized protein YggU (UPF0235/DUF167 family)
VKISIKVKTGAKVEKVEKTGENCFLVFVKARPEKGKANLAVERAVAALFNVSTSRAKVISGSISKNKILEIK